LLDNQTVESMLSIPYAAGEELGYGRGWVNKKFFIDSGHTVGWLTDPSDSHRIHSHSGGGFGVHTLALWRSDGITFVWFTNKDPVIPTIDFPEITSWPDHDLWASVGISDDPVGSAPPESWIPAVVHADGVGESVWRSDVGLLNRSSRTNLVRLRLHRGNQPVDREFEMAPGESRVIPDAVEWFGRSGSGPLQIFSSEGLTVTSRTYNQSIGGTFGQSLDGVTATGGLESGESAVLMQLQENDAARTNIGIHNQWRRSAVVEIALFDGDGSLITGHTREIAPQQTVQLNRPFFKLGHRNDVASGYAVITVVSGQDVYASASVIDNVTGDPTSIPMKSGQGHHLQWIAAAVHGEGAHESQWRTDLSLLNRSGETATVDVSFRGDNGTSSNVVVTLDNGEQRTIGDVVASVGAEGSGSVEIQSSSPVMVASRTYNASDFGTYGLFLDGISGADSCGEGGTVWLPHLLQNDLFRTNVGLVNTGETEARMRVTFFDSSGAELASRSRTLGPGAWLQLQEPFARIAGRTDIDAGYAAVHVQSGQGLIAYASVIDNRTNDGTAISMKR